MIHEARQTAKFVKLVRKLRGYHNSEHFDVETVATGLLERLWHFTLLSAKRGNIGQHDDELIAESVGWYGTPSDLIELLVETEWLDRDDQYRLLVHDWHDHCPVHLKRNIGKLGGFLTQRKRELPAYQDAGSDHLPRSDMQQALTPNLTKPNLTIAPALSAADLETTREAIAYGEVAPKARSVIRDLGGKDLVGDRRLVLAVMALELCGWIPAGTMKSIVGRHREIRPQNTYGMFKTLAKGKCEEAGFDLNQALDAMNVTDEMLSLKPLEPAPA